VPSGWRVPPNLRLVPLPSWSPQLNPAEHVWDELREKHFANRQFASMDQLEEQLVAGLASLEADAPRMASLTGFGWITCVSLNAN
jgi:transposase